MSDKAKIEEEMETLVKNNVQKTKEPVVKRFNVAVDEGHVLNVRSEAKIAQNVIGTLDSNATVTVYGTDGDFSIIRYKGKPAYVMSDKLIEA